MTLIQLEYIVAVDNYRHFVTAAEKCNVTQPTLSMQIKKLEDELGIIIFDRNAKPVEPTEIGIEVLKQARLVLEDAQKIGELILHNRTDISGDLRIGIIPTIAPYLVPLFLPEMVRKFPSLNVFVEELMTHQVVEKMRKGQIDVGIIATPLDEDGITEIPVFYEPFMVYTSSEHCLYHKDKVVSRDLNPDEMWLLADGHCFRNHVLNLCGGTGYYPKQLKFGYKTGSLEILMRFVDQHYGFTLLPYLATLNLSDQSKLCLREFKEPTPKRTVSLIIPEGYARHKIVETLSGHIRKSIPSTLRQLDNGQVINWK
jgi:LysR family transcriptional regulator, hydrogen peroxide-inducible genes activator